jgi:hypothetical protein
MALTLNAQNSEKVKGNRVVTTIITEVEAFHTIEIDEDFEIDIIYNKIPSVEIEADENLHEFIIFSVKDSVLSFDKTRRITSKKALKIKVSYDDYLAKIETRDDGEIYSLTTMNLANGSLKTSGSSKAGLTIKTGNFYFEGLDKSKTELNLTADSTKVILNGNSKLEALIYSPSLSADLYQRSDAIIEGNCDDLMLRTDNNSQFIGKNMTTKSALVFAEISSEITLEVIDLITIEAAGESSINIYGNPKITVNRLTDTTKIQKKVK